ncbi:MAG TPA: GGDEF domain-containing protein [Miltoncostaeaceae bacterium]|nr:GGDEF domain-containing protein [Miltoncostaeaceae bacterium]
MSTATADTAPADAVTDLLETSWGTRGRRLPRRELLFELALTLALVGTCMALAAATGVSPWVPSPVLALTLVGYVLAGRVAYPLGAGNLVPTQPLLVALFALAPPAAVPLLVCLGFALGTIADALRGKVHAERITFSGGNAWHAAGPALVLIVAGADRIHDAPLLVLLVAMLVQVLFDLVFSTVREWVAAGVLPHLQARVIAQVGIFDLALAPLGLLAAEDLRIHAWAPLSLLPLVMLFGYATRDRRRSVERAHERLVALERERTRLRAAVRRVGEAFASTLDVDALLQIVTRAGVDALDAEAGRADTDEGPGAPRYPRARVGDGHDALLAEAAAAAARTGGLGEAADGDAYALACAITAEGRPIGTVAVARGGTPFDHEARSLLAYLCGQASIAAANALRHEDLHHQALTDELTGLANHRRFQEVLAATVDRHCRTGEAGGLVLLDLDRFKSINDNHGHQAGDHVLQAVARVLADSCTGGALPARYGGEELAVVVPGAGEPALRALAERIRRGVEDLRLTTGAGEPLRVTVSGGVAALSPGRGTREELIAASDAALYRAKNAGRNRIEVAAPPASGPASSREVSAAARA